MPIESKRFLIVRSLSSAARIPLPSATSAFAVLWSSAPIVPPWFARLDYRLAVVSAALQEKLRAPQLLVGGGLNGAGADPQRRMNLVPAVLGVFDPRAHDLDSRALVRDGHPGAVLGDDLDDEVAADAVVP